MLLHAMLRVSDPEKSIRFFEIFGLTEVRRIEQPYGRFTLIFLSDGIQPFEIELTHNWDKTDYTNGRNFGHLAFAVDDIYAICDKAAAFGATIARPPRDGQMAFIISPDGISIELLTKTHMHTVPDRYAQMENIGTW